ncbi:type IV pilus secretin PilQ [Larsenimonas rhizosphaerae]|uniref:type IV pilus secretin PilQ n=1 Tax=Larsenimonas rhizosphaerae TaxID=2944682 RepID=UPI0020347278|nr:type IV pilus secretin PilQ [Larsenimonas rhizosphaerae]MCM2129711.1 type IV pilus secretin PilQ [Larsenimonas rhizosphaerae]
MTTMRAVLQWVMLAGVWCLLADSAWGATLDAINVSADSRERVFLDLHFDQMPPAPQSYSLASPWRYVLDLAGVDNGLASARVPVKRYGVDDVVVSGNRSKLRLVINASRPYQVSNTATGNVLRITLMPEGAAGDASSSTGSGVGSPAPVASSPASAIQQVTSIDFKRGDDGRGRLLIELARPGVDARLESTPRGAILVLPETRLPRAWDQVLDVTDFGTPVSRVTPAVEQGDTRFIIAHDGGTPLVAQQGRLLTVDIPPRPSRTASSAPAARRDYAGQLITLDFQAIDIRAVLSLLAEEGGLNLVVSDSVQGSVTLDLQNVPWDQALDIVLKSKGLASRQEGSVLMVAPADELVSLSQRRMAADQNAMQLAELAIDYIQVRYARAEDLALLLKGEEGMGLLSPIGRVMVDPRTNTLLVRDTREQLAQMRQSISRLDIPVRQVQIEARIVIARESVTNELGVRWGASKSRVPGSGINVSGASSGIAGNGGLAVDLGSDNNPTTSFSFGYLSGDVLLDLELNALETEGKSQTISQPRVITANQRKAVIKQGQEIPYQESTSSGATNVAFKEAVLSLEVTPQVTPDNRIIMDLLIKNDDVSSTQYEGAPAIDTNEIQTQVLVNDGETVVLGGILSTEQLRNLYKTPLLGDIPLLGHLFRYTEESNSKVELLVFITPKIIDDSLIR